MIILLFLQNHYNDLKWKELEVPEPTINGRERVYGIDLSVYSCVQISIMIEGYRVLSNDIILTYNREKCLYFVDENGYTWSGFVRVEPTKIIVRTNDNSYNPDSFYLKLDEVFAKII